MPEIVQLSERDRRLIAEGFAMVYRLILLAHNGGQDAGQSQDELVRILLARSDPPPPAADRS